MAKHPESLALPGNKAKVLKKVIDPADKGYELPVGVLSDAGSAPRAQPSAPAAHDGSASLMGLATKAVSTSDTQPGDLHAWSAEPAQTEATTSAMSWPAAGIPYGADGCVDATRTVCRHNDVYRVWWTNLTLQAGDVVKIATSNLAPVGGSWPDTVVFLQQCTDGPACTAGPIVEADDDGNTDTAAEALDSTIDRVVAQAGTYRVIVTGYATDTHGAMDLSIRINSVQVSNYTAVYFGGWLLKQKELRPGDRVMVGKSNEDSALHGMAGLRSYHDAVVWVLGTTTFECDPPVGSTCGPAYFNDDRWFGQNVVWLPWLELPTTFSGQQATIVVGVYGSAASNTCPPELCAVAPQPQPRWKANLRLLHQRRHTSVGGGWEHQDARDNDGDGLTREVEQQLGSCDLDDDSSFWGVGIRGMSCGGYRSKLVDRLHRLRALDGAGNAVQATCANGQPPPCWSSSDSDHDGMRDDMEVWAGAYACPQVPTAPYFDAGNCTPIAADAIAAGCPAAFCSTTALSALSDPDPVVYDLLVENLGVECKNSAGDGTWCTSAVNHPAPNWSTLHRLSAGYVAAIAEPFEVSAYRCWDGSEPANGDVCRDPSEAPIPWDHRYLFHLPWIQPPELVLEDDTTRNELHIHGQSRAHAHIARSQGLVPVDGLELGLLRYGGLGRFIQSLHHGGEGQAANGGLRYFDANAPQGEVCGTGGRPAIASHDQNAIETVVRQHVIGKAFFAHELGHLLSLNHQHSIDHPRSDYCAAPCAEASFPNGQICDATGSSSQAVGWYNLAVSTLMSYHNVTRLPPSANGPATGAATLAGCSYRYARFAKGGAVSIGEAAVHESLGSATWGMMPYWQQVQLTQDLFCARSGLLTPLQVGEFAFATGGTPAYVGPSCDGVACFVNWNSDGGMSIEGPYATNVNHSTWQRPSAEPVACRADVVSAHDELELIQVMGRHALIPWYPKEFLLYEDGFNARVIDNIAGWPTTVTQGVASFLMDQLPVNGCFSNADCTGKLGNPTGTCVFDAPLTPCGVGGDCHSGVCFAGACKNDWGRCTCTADAQCEGSTLPLDLTCDGVTCEQLYTSSEAMANRATKASVNWSHRPQFRHLTTTSSAIALVNAAFPTFLDRKRFTLRFDLRLDGFVQGQTVAAVAGTSAFGIEATSVSGGFGLRITLSTGATVSWVPAQAPLLFGRWHRVRLYVDLPANQASIHVLPWDVTLGRMDLDGAWKSAATTPCVVRNGGLPAAFAGPATTLTLGAPLGLAGTPMQGGLDNVSFDTFARNAKQQPTGICATVNQ